MVYFQTKNPNLGKCWRALKWKMVVYFLTIWNIIHPFGIIYGRLVWLVVIGYIFPNLVCLDQEKSGNSDLEMAQQNSSNLKIKRIAKSKYKKIVEQRRRVKHANPKPLH
jgi:hypothetical protein